MRKFVVYGAAVFWVLAGVTAAFADCCSVPVMSKGGLTEEQVMALIQKVMGAQTAVCQNPVNNKPAPTEPNPNENTGNVAGNKGETPPGPGGDGTVDPKNLTSAQQIDNVVGTASATFGEEPVQRAVIAWNRVTNKEILSLEVLHHANAKGTMLSFMPLSGPVSLAKQGDKSLFKKSWDLVVSKQGSDAVPGVAPLQYKTAFGAHHIFVWHVDNEKQFFRRIQKFVKDEYKGQAIALFNKQVEDVIQDYFHKGYRYFAFDLVECSKLPSKREAIEYHFTSKYLFYPVEITRGGAAGKTRIELVAFTDSTGVNQFFGGLKYKQGKGSIEPYGSTVKITDAELGGLNHGMGALFQQDQQLLGRIWVIRGELSELRGDLAARLSNP